MVRNPKLDTVGRVAEELAKLYCKVRRAELTPADGQRMAGILATLKACHESSEFERRIAGMEAQLNPVKPPLKFVKP